MLQTKKLLALAVVLAALISVATIAYENYIQDEIYQESADHLLETYGQVANIRVVCAAQLERAVRLGQ